MSISDWKRAIYALCALPAFVGGAGVQRRLARRWAGVEPDPMAKPRYGAAAGVSLVSFLVALLVWYLVGRIATYGFFWTQEGAAESWGGPSLIGAWVVHFFAALGMAVVAMWVLRPLVGLQTRLLAPELPSGQAMLRWGGPGADMPQEQDARP